MLHALASIRPGYLLLGAAIAVGAYAVRGAEPTHARLVPPAPAPKPVAAPFVRITPPPSLDTISADDAEPVEEVEDEIIVHGLEPLDGPEAFAMVFEVDGTYYLRLSEDEHAASHGRAQLVIDGEGLAAVAGVATSAMPEELRAWAGRRVLVDGMCAARVVGFAEVSRVAGDPPGTEEYYYEEEDKRPKDLPVWNLENVRDANVMLAAKLDGVGDCGGTWARASEYAPAVIAHQTEEPELENAALADLMASAESEDEQKAWSEMGGEGNWRDDASVDVTTWEHPDTGERWIFASATTGGGGCGEPGASAMAVYRVAGDGKVRKVTNLEYAGYNIRSVVDIDGDGQPELLVGAGESTDLVDLAGESHESISRPYYTWGCGC